MHLKYVKRADKQNDNLQLQKSHKLGYQFVQTNCSKQVIRLFILNFSDELIQSSHPIVKSPSKKIEKNPA